MKKKFLLLFVLCAVSTSCGDIFYHLYVYNDARFEIRVHIADGGGKPLNVVYPDTCLPDTTWIIDIGMLRKIKSGSHYEWSSRMMTWDEKISYLPKDTLSVYIIHGDTFNKYPWKEIARKNMILKRYDLSVEDIREMDYKIHYPDK